MRTTILVAAFIVLTLAFASEAASQSIIALQGRAVNSATGQLLTSGNVTLRIYTAKTSGTLAYEENFTSAIFNGTFNIVAGNNTDLNLTYNTRYWMELLIDGTTVIGSGTGSGRHPFYPTSGPKDATEINLSTGGTIEARLNTLSSNLTAINNSFSNYLSTSASFGGDDSRTYGSIQLGTGVVGS